MAENRAASPLRNTQMADNGDTTGDDPIEGTVHVMQDEMIANGDGVFAKEARRVPAPANKARAAVPEEGAPVSAETAPAKPARAAPRKSARRK